MVSVLITERFSLKTLVQLQTHPGLSVIQDSEWYKKPIETWAAIEILVIRTQTKIDEKSLRNFPNLRLIISTTAGFNHIDLELCQKLQITISHCPLSHSASTAELTWALVLACARRLHEAHRAIKTGDWDRQKLLGVELSGKTYGVIGLGRVGSRVARIAQAFNMSVMAHDPYQSDEYFEPENIERVSLEELLTQSDVISVHVPLTRETWHFLGEAYLESLSPHCILVNTCRGPVFHEKALVHLLQRGQVGALGLDVFEYEPLDKNSPLLRYSNVVTTPHLGATTQEAFEKASDEAFLKIQQYLKRLPLEDTLPPKAAWYKAGEML